MSAKWFDLGNSRQNYSPWRGLHSESSFKLRVKAHELPRLAVHEPFVASSAWLCNLGPITSLSVWAADVTAEPTVSRVEFEIDRRRLAPWGNSRPVNPEVWNPQNIASGFGQAEQMSPPFCASALILQTFSLPGVKTRALSLTCLSQCNRTTCGFSLQVPSSAVVFGGNCAPDLWTAGTHTPTYG